MKRKLLGVGGGLLVCLALFALLQLVPLDRTNPPVTREVKWDADQTRALAQRACSDCHSNQTVWPWYARVAPASFLIVNHVVEGRSRLNFSQWDGPNADFREVQRTVSEGEMPRGDYLLMHPEARFTAAETSQLLAGLQTTFQQDPPIARPGRFGR